GTIPSTVNPPHDPAASSVVSAPSSEPVVAVTRPSSALLASAAPNAESDNIFSNLARKMGFGGSDTTASAKPPAAVAKPKAVAPKHVAPHRSVVAAKPAAPKPAEPKQVANARPPFKPTVASSDAPASTSAALPGAAPVVSSSSFDSRFSAFR
ncbi:MAG: hypothetical protein JSS22_02355, partial [Proteobacteria bacterium]|nr:hypothetical protein [Pseudomonadota bacterium]